MVEFLSLKELHRPPPPPRDQTSTQARYLTPNTNAAKRLGALRRVRHSAFTDQCWLPTQPGSREIAPTITSA